MIFIFIKPTLCTKIKCWFDQPKFNLKQAKEHMYLLMTEDSY